MHFYEDLLPKKKRWLHFVLGFYCPTSSLTNGNLIMVLSLIQQNEKSDETRALYVD